MNESLSQMLEEINILIEEYQPVTYYDYIFEDTEVTQDQQNKNNEIAETIGDKVQKVIEVILTTITKIKNFIKHIFMGNAMEEKESDAYKMFRSACSHVPFLRNKKISVEDFNALKNKTTQFLNMFKTELAGPNAEPSEVLAKLAEEVVALANGKEALKVSISCEQALARAKGSREEAKKLFNILNEDEAVYNSLKHTLGRREARKFKSQVKGLTRKVSFERLKLSVLGHVTKSLENKHNKICDLVLDVAETAGTARRVVKRAEQNRNLKYSKKHGLVHNIMSGPKKK